MKDVAPINHQVFTVNRQRVKQICSGCKKSNHTAENCFFLHPELRPPQSKKQTKKVYIAKDANTEELMQFALPVIMAAKTTQCSQDMLVDSGASSHIVNTLHNFKPQNGNGATTIQIAIGDGTIMKAEAIGTLTLNIIDDNNELKELILKDVLYVPKMQMNLLSVSKLTNSDNAIVHIGGTETPFLQLQNHTKIPLVQDSGLFYLKIWYINRAMTANSTAAADLLRVHRSHGHINMRQLAKFYNLTTTKSFEDCEECLQSKSTRLSKVPRLLLSPIHAKHHFLTRLLLNSHQTCSWKISMSG